MLLSNLTRQDKKKEKILEGSVVFQHMVQEQSGTIATPPSEDEAPQCLNLQESLQAIVEYLKNIQYHYLHDLEDL